jgi:hypothetical protein
MWQGYKEGGIIGAINEVNPFYQIGKAGAQSYLAVVNGDYREGASKGIVAAVLAAVTVVGIIQGAGALAGKAPPPGAGAGVAGAAESSGVVESTSIGRLRASGAKDAHHIIQDAAVRDLPGYNTNAAPGIRLPGPSNVPGTPHHAATQVQRQAGGGTYAVERRIGYKALRKAGIGTDEARSTIRGADAYFESLGVGPSTVTRIPGNRR